MVEHLSDRISTYQDYVEKQTENQLRLGLLCISKSNSDSLRFWSHLFHLQIWHQCSSQKPGGNSWVYLLTWSLNLVFEPFTLYFDTQILHPSLQLHC